MYILLVKKIGLEYFNAKNSCVNNPSQFYYHKKCEWKITKIYLNISEKTIKIGKEMQYVKY